MLSVNTNIASLNAQVNLANNSSSLQTAIQRLSSGLRINSAKDDAAGYAISSRMTSQINGANQAVLNANDGASLAQTAGGALSTIADNLQSIRTLAVQAANASNSASDRATIQNQASQLLASINSIASSTSFNGVNLLDGTFTNQTFQVGANGSSSNQITIGSISSAQTSQMGSAGLTTSANLTSGVTTAALNAGDVTLNGQQVGASLAGTGPGQTASSAYAIAQAINAVAANSGVTATANTTTVAGTAASAFTAIAANTFSLNGINIGAVAAGVNAAGQGANLAAAINTQATLTGVSASADATTGAVTLTAANGTDIKISQNVVSGATAASAQRTTLLAQTGFAAANVGEAGTTTVASGAFTSASSATATDIYKVTVDGISVTSRTGATAATAAQLDTDFQAFVAANSGYTLTGTFAAGTAQLTKADGTAVAVKTSYTDSTGLADAAGAVLGGALFGGAVPSTAVGVTTTTTAGNFGATAGSNALSNHGTVSLTSNNSAGIVVGGAHDAYAGLTAGTTNATTVSSVNAVGSINLSSASGATSALAVIDAAINSINVSSAALGALQNRFTSTVSNLQATSQNLTAARSQIQDTDFAATTAAMTRGQILQQAGTAMLAQANSLPQSVLSLLK